MKAFARLLSVCGASGVLLLTSVGDACRCLEVRSASAAYKHADVVVVGQVESITPHLDDVDGADVSLEVTRAWKANVSAQLRITTGSPCAFALAAHGSYLLFLQRTSGGAYTTGRCMGNRELTNAKSFVSWLRKNGRAGAVLPGAADGAK